MDTGRYITMDKISKLKALAKARSINKQLANEKLVGEEYQQRHAKELLKPIVDAQKQGNITSTKLLDKFKQFTQPRRPAILPVEVPEEVAEPVIEEVTEPLEYPDIKPGILSYQLSGKGVLTYVYSEDKLDTMTPKQLRKHYDDVTKFMTKAYTTMRSRITKADKVEYVTKLYDIARIYHDYLINYIYTRENEASGEGLKFTIVSMPKKNIKTTPKTVSRIVAGSCNIIGSPKEVLDKLKLNIASIQAGNTSNVLKNNTIDMLDYLHKNKHINTKMYKQYTNIL